MNKEVKTTYVNKKGVLVPKNGLPVVEERWPKLARFPLPVSKAGAKRNVVSQEVD